MALGVTWSLITNIYKIICVCTHAHIDIPMCTHCSVYQWDNANQLEELQEAITR